jgi:uncharacterized protein YneF (UPF0154 family)
MNLLWLLAIGLCLLFWAFLGLLVSRALKT